MYMDHRYTFTTIVLLCSAFAHAQLPQAYIDRLQFVLDSTCTARNLKGASAAVVVPGMGVWAGVYGESYAGTPIDPTMFLGVGSNTKTYVATTLLKLQEQGLVDLDDTVGTWVQHPNIDGAITIRQLLNHSSGLYNFTNSVAWSNAVFSDLGQIWDPQDLLQYVADPEFPAGTSWEYSNSNYLVAGLIIEAVTGGSLHDALADLVLTPAGLDSSELYVEGTDALNIPHIWTDAFEGYLEDLIADYGYEHNSVMSAAWAAGGIVATAKDNAMYWSKLMEGELLTEGSWTEMSTTIPIGSGMSYGLGIFKISNFNGQTVWSHGGTNLGFINENIGDPLSGVGISVLTNQDSIGNGIVLNGIVKELHQVTLDPTIGIAEASIENFSIYPNPATDVIQIDRPLDGSVELTVFDPTGRAVLRIPSIGSNEPVDVRDLPAGSYVLELSDGAVRSVGRMLVVR